LGDCFTLGGFLKIAQVAQNFLDTFFARYKLRFNFGKTWVGLHFGRFFRKLIWTPRSCYKAENKCQEQKANFRKLEINHMGNFPDASVNMIFAVAKRMPSSYLFCDILIQKNSQEAVLHHDIGYCTRVSDFLPR
jgi:hypothetical protein